MAGPKHRIRERRAGVPDLTAAIADMFSACDKIVMLLVWRGTHTGSYGYVKAEDGRREIRDFAVWCFGGGQVVEISTIQDQWGAA